MKQPYSKSAHHRTPNCQIVDKTPQISNVKNPKHSSLPSNSNYSNSYRYFLLMHVAQIVGCWNIVRLKV